MAGGAVRIHDMAKISSEFEDLKHAGDRTEGNIYTVYRLCTGDFDQVAQAADRVFEHDLSTAAACAVPLETTATIAVPAMDGLTIYSTTQFPSYVRRQIAKIFGYSEAAVRVVQRPLGGGFGLKAYIRLEAITVGTSLAIGRPISIKTDMEETFYLPGRRSAEIRIASAMSNDGRILARRCRLVWNGGAYADVGPRMVQKSGLAAAGPYDIPVVDVESLGVYTNRVPAGAIRGFGIPQVAWGHEIHTDMIAAELGIDGIEFRRMNLLSRNALHATGTSLKECDPKAVLEELVRKMGPRPERSEGDLRLGRGIAIGIKAVMTPSTSVAKVTIATDGSCTVHTGTVEMGQGSTVTMAQIAANGLGIPVEEVRVVTGDTDSVPWDTGTLGSRSTYHMAKAIEAAVQDVRTQLAQMVNASKGPSTTADSVANIEGGYASILRYHFGSLGATVTGLGSFTPPYVPADSEGRSATLTEFWMCGANGVDLRLDPRTGVIRLERLVSVADVGRAIHPELVHTQLSGAALMQASISLAEEVKYDEDGQVLNTGLAFYRIFGFGDTPDSVVTSYVETSVDAAPRGVGESGTFGVGPAIAAAVHDAVGVWIRDMPITAERVLRAIRGPES
jgi:CO/xanthine dehydrogenase Mo-binding subunit